MIKRITDNYSKDVFLALVLNGGKQKQMKNGQKESCGDVKSKCLILAIERGKEGQINNHINLK